LNCAIAYVSSPFSCLPDLSIYLAPIKEGLDDVLVKYLRSEQRVRELTEELSQSKAETAAAQLKLTKIMNLPGLASYNASGAGLEFSPTAPVSTAPTSPSSSGELPKKKSHSRNHSRNSSGGTSSSVVKSVATGTSLREGWLDRYANKKLQRRFFVLKPTTLLSYKSDKADRDKPLGQLEITMAQIAFLEEVEAQKLCGERFVFKVLDPATLVTFVLVAKTQEDVRVRSFSLPCTRSVTLALGMDGHTVEA